MKAIIVDDERLARQELKSMLSAYKDIEIIAECANALEAKDKINTLKPDVVFLDIQMPGKNGLELAQELEPLPELVFITAHDEYALRAFEVNALDYLLKPIQTERLAEAVKKLNEKEEQTPKEYRSTLHEDDQVFLKDGDRCWFVKLSEIRLFESEGNYVRVYFENNKPLILRSLNNLEQRLHPDSFFRASRKHIINLKWIENIETWFNGGLMVKLKGGEKVEISRRQAIRLKDMMSL
ncbi:MAG: LytTR family transcriptional regulator DNA-binding domain-containing protein [Bacteroidetes bacterium]|nr:LytTR family transcriptional regulator DNA-binding domain-containing protein [Bacteroidota bacterium]